MEFSKPRSWKLLEPWVTPCQRDPSSRENLQAPSSSWRPGRKSLYKPKAMLGLEGPIWKKMDCILGIFGQKNIIKEGKNPPPCSSNRRSPFRGSITLAGSCRPFEGRGSKQVSTQTKDSLLLCLQIEKKVPEIQNSGIDFLPFRFSFFSSLIIVMGN